MPSKLTKIAKQLLLIEQDLPYRLDYARDKMASVSDFEVFIFQQLWPSTATGFSGIGGQMLTSQVSYVFVPASCDQNCFVYFGGQFAYQVPYTEQFLTDVRCFSMASVSLKSKYAVKNIKTVKNEQ